jgi:NADH:ubiquinone reductase (H+-translocating)
MCYLFAMNKKKVVVLGGGFAGLQLVRNLDTRYFDVLLIDKINHHQFQPLFYQVATAQIEPASISFPLRHIFKRKKNLQIRMADVQSLNLADKQVVTDSGVYGYDILVIATGCTTNFYGNDQIAEHAFTLKTTYDAIAIRNHVISNFEHMLTASPEDRQRMANLVIVGAGPTGVELAGAFAEIRSDILPRDYPGADFSDFSVYLVEGSANTLNAMSQTAKVASADYLRRMGVHLITETVVKAFDGRTAVLSNGQEIPTDTLIWAAGVTGNFLSGLPEASRINGNRIIVDRYNAVENIPDVYAIGDIARMQTPAYPKGHPQVANVAINQAKKLAANLKRMQSARKPVEYEYKNLGAMATVGRNKAVVDLPFIRFKGFFAWLTWMFLHLMLILSVRNKLIIFINWAWSYLFKDSSLRIILKPRKPRLNAED